MSQRDEQFAGFALAVVEKITSIDEYDETDMEIVIARAAYDLVCHTILHFDTDLKNPELFTHMIPDLPVLPEEKSEC